jgi:hypothetical protein
VRNGAGRVSRGRADGEGRTVIVMQNNLSRQGLEIRGGTCRGGRVSGWREYGGERAEAGTGMNRNKPELNRKSTTLPTEVDPSVSIVGEE